MPHTKSPALSARFTEALTYAHELHATQLRKGADTPYIGHLLAVAALVIEAGGDEDEAIAALLHDGPEDTGGQATLDEIRDRFGDGVADIVEHCSDTLVEDRSEKEEWWDRKRRYHHNLAGASASTLLVSLADKVHNAETTRRDSQREGSEVFNRFTTGSAGTLWNYARLLEIYRKSALQRLKPLVDRLEQAVDSFAGSSCERIMATFFEPESVAEQNDPILYIVAGGVGAGKSSFIRPGDLTAADPAGPAHFVHLDAPRIFLALCQGEVLDFPGELEEQIEAIGRAIASRAVSERRHILVEVIGHEDHQLETVLDRFRAAGYTNNCHWLTCSVDEAQERNHARGENNISAYYAEPFHYRWLSGSTPGITDA